jgi:hypothetical protein
MDLHSPPLGEAAAPESQGMRLRQLTPQARPRSPWRGPVAILGVAVAAVVVVVASAFMLLRPSTGIVSFSRSAFDQGSGACQFASPITSASTSDSFYMIAFFNDTLAVHDTYALGITKDGVPFRQSGNLTADTRFQCYVEADALGPLAAGVYDFTFTHNGTVEAAGSITIR